MSLILAYMGILAVLIIALNARYLGDLLGVMDDPNREGHKSHVLPTPLVGALMLGALAIFMILDHYLFNASSKMVGVSTCTIMIAFLGFADDKLRLSWQVRLFAILAVSSLLVYWVPEVRLESLRWSFGLVTYLGPIGGAAFTVICLATLVISFNMMDGYNGGVIGLSLILFVVMAFVAENAHRQAICLFLASALGIMFLYNMKGEFFLGDGGAYALGLLVGAVALLTYNVDASVPIYADTIFVWLALPTLDCLRVVVSRKLKRESPFYAGRDHLHHIVINALGAKTTLLLLAGIVGISSWFATFSREYTWLVLLVEVASLAYLIRLSAIVKSKNKLVN